MRFVRSMLWALIVLGYAMPAAHAGVTPAIQKAIRAATFEVVRKKPEKDPLQYEKPLPLELLPYTERNDAYQSIGTAFALGNNTYVTAAHVLAAGVNSQYGPPSLRTADGRVYSVDQITRFSNCRDFAIFSLAGDPAPPGLAVNRTPQLDDPVLAVGNAFGEGIVIRDGLLTSETPEDQNGRWKWIRFSAAASPGSSGGPLLDATGKVIGIVIGKSPDENLNYALPIREMLDAAENRAIFDQRMLTQFPVLPKTRAYTFTQELVLPMRWQEFAKAYEDVVTHHDGQARAELLHAYEDQIFPDGPGTESLLYSPDAEYTPRLIAQQTDHTWAAISPGHYRADLPGDGYVDTIEIAASGLSLLKLHRSDAAADDAFYGDSRNFMEIALKGLTVTRTVGSDNVRVTSLGAALSETLYTDRYGRKWQQRIWPLPYLDAYIIGMLLPTPDGYAALLQYTPSSMLRSATLQSNLLTDYIDISFSGSIAQWQAYLGRRALLPLGLGDLRLNSGKDLELSTGRFVFRVPGAIMKVDQHSDLDLHMHFMRDGAHVAWDAGGVRVYQDTQKRSWVELSRRKQPPPTAGIELRNEFSTMQNRRSPYDMQPSREKDDIHTISGVINAPGITTGNIFPDVLYGVTLALEGTPEKTDLVVKQNLLLSGIRILEHGDAPEVAPSMNDHPDGSAQHEAKVREWLVNVRQFADQLSLDVGTDIRGRVFAQDASEYLTEPIEKSLTDPSISLVERYETFKTVNARAYALSNYWQHVKRLNSHRLVWPVFLQANRLEAATAHSGEVRMLEQKLRDLFAGAPTPDWGAQAKALIHAYFDERRQLAIAVPVQNDQPFTPRESACPPASDATSGTDKPRYVNKSAPMELNYPEASRVRNDEGVVVLSVQVSETGCATAARIVGHSGFPDLDNAAMKLYERARFLPAEQDGKAVPAVTILPVAYKFQE